jgi:RNA polymerase sigma-70 factor (ECF subfamily)
MLATADSSRTNRLLTEFRSGGRPHALDDLFALHRERLRRYVRLRLDRQLRGRLSSNSILDRAYLAAHERLPEYDPAAAGSLYLWLRQIVGEEIQAVHRENDVLLENLPGRELQLLRGALPDVTAASMAAQLLGDRAANQSAARANMLLLLEGALNGMERLDREVLALRNFEELTADEAAKVLGLSKAAATVLHLKAVKRLNDILASIPGFLPARSRATP